MKSNEDISDNGCHDGLEHKVNSHINNQGKSIYGKMSSNITTEKKRKNIFYDDPTDNKLKNLEMPKAQKDEICCLCTAFKNMDSYYAKKILIALGISVEKTNNRNMYVYNEEKMSYIKIFSLFLPYIILIIVTVLIFFVEVIEHAFPYLFGLGFFMIFYILIKAIKYAVLQKKNKKKIINK
ncbi:hypothetical protein PVP01_0002220 [Plasmodium vivax]|uniref:Uncharacterized protein n=1 Tax=Plasmodium vivax TaxID=5855 RepID=A0A565A3Y6_PLAVI|nr:hypothetical protein PVP01_0002220 [Plasmodium vivax]